MVVPFADSSEALCTDHPTPCKKTFCRSYWINYGIVKITGSQYSHCELYWPYNQLSISVDQLKNVHSNKSRSYITAIGRWVFLYMYVTDEQERLIMQYMTMQKGKPYDNTSFYMFGVLSCTSCFQPATRPLRHETSYDLNDQQLRAKLPPSETCSRLLMGALIYAGVVDVQDIRLATPRTVFEALVRAGAQSTDVLPSVPDSQFSCTASAFEMALQQTAIHSYSGESVQYALSGGFCDAPSTVHGGAPAGGGAYCEEDQLMSYSSSAEYYQALGVAVPATRFAPLQ